MKKIWLSIFLIVCFYSAFSQPVVNRAGPSNTIIDSRLGAGFNLFVPRYTDTLTASLSKGIDSAGAIIYTYDVSNFWVRKHSPKRWVQVGTGTSSSIPIDVFTIAGQSNAVGNSTNPSAAIVPKSGTAFQFYNGAISAATEPIGNSNGSAWGAFAETYYKLTGNLICFVPAGVNGSGMAAVANSGHGTWDTTGNLYDTSVSRTTAALTALTNAGYSPNYKGILWSQGENDADFINRGAETSGTYQAAFAKLIKRYRLQFGSSISFNIFRTGYRTDTIATGYTQVQNVQQTLANPDSLINIVFWNPPYFPARGLMFDVYHYTQPGYNEMGRQGAESFINSTSNIFQAQNGNIFFNHGNVGIGAQSNSLTGIPTNPLTIAYTGTAKEIYLKDSLNDAVRMDIENKSAASFAGAGIRLTNDLGLRSQYIQLSSTSFLIPDATALIASGNGGLIAGSDVAGIDLYTGGTTSLLNSKFRITSSGNIGVGNNITPVASAQLEINTTTRGFLPPRMNTTQQNAISSPATALFIYNTDSSKMCFYNGSAWICNATGGSIPSFSKSIVNTANVVTLVNDTTSCDTCAYASINSIKRWYSGLVLDSTGFAGGATYLKLSSGHKLVLSTITTTPPGNNLDIIMNFNGTYNTPGSDSLKWNTTSPAGLDTKGQYLIGGLSAVYFPNQTNFAKTEYIGNQSTGGSALSHSSGIQGGYNTVTGNTAGNAITTGSANTLNGAEAGKAITSAVNNTAIGADAMFTHSTGDNNTAVGKGAMQNGTGSVSSVALGREALLNNAAQFNTGVGDQALDANTSGLRNVGVGPQTGFFNATGSHNVSVGAFALTGVTGNNNSDNTALGYLAANGCTTCSRTISIGDSADYNMTNVLHSITIGSALQNNGSNSLNIGGLVFGTGMTATGTSTAGSMGILATSPNSTLQIGGSFATAYVAKAVDYGPTISDQVIEVTATGHTITLPTAVGITGRIYTIKLTASGSATVATTSSQTIDASTTYSLSAQYKFVTVQSNGSGWIIIGNN